jgi:hypothetical protein
MLLLLALACSWSDEAAPVAAPDVPLPPEPALGVTEVVTPPGVARLADPQDLETPVHLDVSFDASATTFDGLGTLLDAWGFARLDGDGESWRVKPPAGRAWIARLEGLAEVREVREALDRETLETGAYREGRETYGAVTHAWSWREGGAQEQVTGGAPPPPPVFPDALPAWAVSCLQPARDEMRAAVARGVGWERALRADPAAWVLVVQDYGACRARGWVPLVRDGDVSNLTVAGRAVAAVRDEDLQESALEVLHGARASDDPAAEAAVAQLVSAPAEVVARAAEASMAGLWQRTLLRAWAARDPDAALAWARASSIPGARALLVVLDPLDRSAALADPATPPDVVLAALGAWRPAPGEGTDVLARLRTSPDPRVRDLAWERTLEQEAPACLPRVDTLATASLADAQAAWRSCPFPAVREAAWTRARSLDQASGDSLLDETLQAPETLENGVLAVRLAARAGRHDLLAALVARRTVRRDVRREALRACLDAGAPGAAQLEDLHGRYLGLRRAPADPPHDAAPPASPAPE